MIARVLWPLLVLLIIAAGVPQKRRRQSGVGAHLGLIPVWRRTVVRYCRHLRRTGTEAPTALDFEILGAGPEGRRGRSRQKILSYKQLFQRADRQRSRHRQGGRTRSSQSMNARSATRPAVDRYPHRPIFDERRNRIIAYSHVDGGRQDTGGTRCTGTSGPAIRQAEFERFLGSIIG